MVHSSSIVDPNSSFIFRVSFPDFDKLICARSPTNITCIDEEPFVLILIVQIQLGVQDDSLQPMEGYVIVGPFYPRRRAVGPLLCYIVYGFGNDPVIFNVVTELLDKSKTGRRPRDQQRTKKDARSLGRGGDYG
jgi:hypothetical protein